MNISISPRRVAAFLWDHWRRHPARGSLLIALMLISVAFDVAFPIVSGRLVDAVTQAEMPPAPSDIDLVLLALWLFVGQAVGFQTSRRAAMLVWAGFASRIMREIVTEAFHRVQRYPTDCIRTALPAQPSARSHAACGLTTRWPTRSISASCPRDVCSPASRSASQFTGP